MKCIFSTVFSLVLIGSNTGQKVAVDQLGTALDPTADECEFVRTIGVFDLLDIPMDVKQMMGVLQHMVCLYDYSERQFDQLMICIRVALDTGRILPLNADPSVMVEILTTSPPEILCTRLSPELVVRKVQIETARSIQQLVGSGCDSRQVGTSLAKCIINQPNISLPCINVNRLPRGDCVPFEPSPACGNLAKRTLTCPDQASLDLIVVSGDLED